LKIRRVIMARIDIYTIRYCPYCQEAKELLSRKGASFHEIDASGNRALRQQMIERSNGRTTFPQIFIGATHVGGCDDLCALDEAGGLGPLLAELTDRTESKDQAELKDQPREQSA
jgi:glutaredoxin 3